LFAGQLVRLHRQSAELCGCRYRPLRGLRHAGPLERRAPPGPGIDVCCCLSAITAASAPAGSAGPGRELTRRPRRVGNDRRIRPTPAAAPRRCPRL